MMDDFNQARAYDSNSSAQREDGFNLMDLLCLEERSKVLDLGCGTGYLTKVLANRVEPMGKVVGIDPDTDRLQLAREKYPAPNLTYQEGTAEDIPGSDYDAVFSNSVLHWCKDKDAIFKKVMDSLKKGGKFGFVTPNNFDIVEQFCSPADMFSKKEYRQYFINLHHIPSREDLRDIISENRFQITHMSESIREWRFEDVNKLVEFFRVAFSELDGRHYNVEAMKRHYGDGEIIFKMPYITAVVVK